MKLFGFMQDRKWYEDIGHIFIGLVPYWGWDRERRQDPPGDPLYVVVANFGEGKVFVDASNDPTTANGIAVEVNGRVLTYYPKARCDDRMRDLLGYALGDVIRTAVLVGLLIWRW